jgi:hypothetical protein
MLHGPAPAVEKDDQLRPIARPELRHRPAHVLITVVLLLTPAARRVLGRPGPSRRGLRANGND